MTLLFTRMLLSRFTAKMENPFDSDWEDAVITNGEGNAGKVPTSQDITRAKDDWEVSTYGSSERCTNYMITRPGGIA